MTVYGIPNCNTVKKALDFLKAANLDFEFHNFKKDGITAEKIQLWFNTFGWERVINKKGLTFRKLSAEAQQAVNSPETALAYLLENTSAIKRPVIEANGQPILLGFNETEYNEVL